MRPIPPRLEAALARVASSWPTYRFRRVPRGILRELEEPRTELSTVDLAHLRSANRLLRAAQGRR